MQKYELKKGTTSKIILIDIYDSTSTTGARLAGLVYNSAGLSAYYNREGAAGAATAITLVTATKGTYSSGGFVAIDGTNMPGHYELHIPNAALATGANSVMIELKGATNMVPKTILVELADNVVKDTYDIVNHVDYGNAKLVRSTTPANTLAVTAANKISGVVTTDALTTNNDKTGYTLTVTPPTAAVISDTVWDEVMADHLGAGSTGEKLNSAASAGDPWTTLLPGSYGVGTAGKIIGNNIDTTISSRSTYAGGAVDSVTGAVGSVTGAVGSVTADVGITQAGADKVWSSTSRTLSSFGTLVADIWNNATRSLTDKAGFALSATGIAAIWDALLTGITTTGSIGKLIKDNVDAMISSRSTYAGADTAGTTTLLARIASALTITAGKVDVNDKTGFALSTAGVAAIWNALTSGMITVGSIGKKLADWVVGTIDTYTGNTKQSGDNYTLLGTPTGASIAADIQTRSSHTAADVATSILTTPANKLATNASGKVTAESVDALGTQAKIDVNTEVDNALDSAIPAVPTLNSINERLKAVDDKLPTGNLSDFDEATNPVELLAAGGTAGVNAEELVDNVFEEVAADHNIAGTMGAKINSSGASGNPLNDPVPGSYVVGTAGYNLGYIDEIKAKTDAIGAANVSLTSPVTTTGDAVIRSGDDYAAADGRSLDWVGGSGWPDLSGATVSFKVTSPRGEAVLTKAGSIVIPTGTNKQIRVELTSSETAALTAGTYRFEMEATLASGNKATLIASSLTVEVDT